MLKCIIIDDEPLAIQLLADYAKKSKDLELIGSFTNPIEALHSLEDKGVDLVFLDIQMPELTGIQFMKIARNNFRFILTTAYENYALESYEFDVVDYLLKPISLERFLSAIEKAKQRIANNKETVSRIEESITPSFLFVKTGYKTQKINYDEILFFEGLGDYVAIHTKTEKVLTLEKMKYFEQTLSPKKFIRVHKSFIVSIGKIEFIEKNRIIIEKKHIPIGATYSDKFWKKIKE